MSSVEWEKDRFFDTGGRPLFETKVSGELYVELLRKGIFRFAPSTLGQGRERGIYNVGAWEQMRRQIPRVKANFLTLRNAYIREELASTDYRETLSPYHIIRIVSCANILPLWLVHQEIYDQKKLPEDIAATNKAAAGIEFGLQRIGVDQSPLPAMTPTQLVNRMVANKGLIGNRDVCSAPFGLIVAITALIMEGSLHIRPNPQLANQLDGHLQSLLSLDFLNE